MCGITGIWTNALPPEDRVTITEKMQSEIAFRGKDGQGVWHDSVAGVSLSHTRLAITGDVHQPLISYDKKLVLVFSGEIYNWLDIRREFEAEGEQFHTNGDAEVIFPLYQKHGTDAVNYLEGMFAFLLYDRERRELIGARDAFGEKPLFLTETVSGIFLSSSIAALTRVPNFDSSFDSESLIVPLIGNFHHCLSPYTVYRSCRAVRPGSLVVINSSGIKEHRYIKSLSIQQKISVDKLKGTVSSSVLQAGENDHIGILCSGGQDSAVIASLLCSKGRKVPLITAWSDDKTELVLSRRLAERYNATVLPVKLTLPQILTDFDSLLRGWHEPVAVWSLTAFSACARAAKEEGLKVLVSGSGADELFFGYKSHRTTYIASVICAYFPFLAGIFPEVSVLKAAPGKRKLLLYHRYAENLFERIPELSGFVDIGSLLGRFDEEFSRLCELLPSSRYIDESNFIGLATENAHSVAMAGDVPGLKEGIEIRSPFLNYRLVSEVFSFSPLQKLSTFSHQKKLLRNLFPEVPLPSRKQGLGCVLPSCWQQSQFWMDLLHGLEQIDPQQTTDSLLPFSSLVTAGNDGAQPMKHLLPRIAALRWWCLIQKGQQEIAARMTERLQKWVRPGAI